MVVYCGVVYCGFLGFWADVATLALGCVLGVLLSCGVGII